MVYLIALISALTGFLFGFDEGIVSGVLPMIKEAFVLNDKQVGFMMGLMPFGALVSACVIGRFSDWAGRLRVLHLVPILFAIAIVILMTTSSYFLLCVSRVLLGVSIGMSVVISPLYIAEAAPSEIRGKLVIYFQLAITIGIFCSYLINLFAVGHIPWRMIFAAGFIPSALLFFGSLFLPESPRWLCSRGRLDEAEEALCRLYGKEKAKRELREIEQVVHMQKEKKNWKELFSKKIRPSLLVGMLLFFFQQLSGINAVIYYAPTIFGELRLGGHFAGLLATLGLGAVNVFMTVLSMRWIEKFGRRPLLIAGFIGTAGSLFFIALLEYFQVPSLGWLSVLLLFVYISAFAIGLGPLPWVMMPEIFPVKVRGEGAGFSAGSNWAFNTIVVATFPILLHEVGISLTFVLYAIACVLGLLFSLYYVPETKHLSLEEIEAHIQSGKPLRTLRGKRN